MRKDSRLSRVLHILAHMNVKDEPKSSSQIAKMLSTNPVVIRRIMGLLRDADYVTSTKGRDGGWMLTRPLNDITLLDIYKLFGDTSLFTIGLTDEHSGCPIEKSINREIGAVLNDAEELILIRFNEITLDIIINHYQVVD